MATTAAVAAAIAIAGCRFDPGARDAQDDSDAAPDARADAAPACAFPYAPVHFDPCAADVPTPEPSTRLDMPGEYRYDTDTGELTAPDATVTTPANAVVDNVRFAWFEAFELGAASKLRVQGELPFGVASRSDITIAGELDASSKTDAPAQFSLGAGANPSVCSATAANPGRTCDQHGGSGGGGGGFGDIGGGGGGGGNGRDCDDGVFEDGIPGGSGGAAVELDPSLLRGGCPGADGGPNKTGDNVGVGGPGGGAIHLVARGTARVTGALHAGGAGGAPALDDRAGGGGGGSGGTIGLEARRIEIGAAAILAANGGGGGGGCNSDPAEPGEDGRADAVQAAGGDREGSGGDGGSGGAAVVLPGLPGARADRGGGGGGGAVGAIVLYTPLLAADIAGAATISPAHTEL